MSMRLTHDREYQRVYRARTHVTRGPLRLSAVPNGRARTRLGLSVPKRVGTNVQRNAVKRLLREAFRLEQGGMPQGLDLVIGVHPHALLPLEQYRLMLAQGVAELHHTWQKRQQRQTGAGPGEPPAGGVMPRDPRLGPGASGGGL